MNIMKYESLTVVELKKIAKEKEIKGAYKMRKNELVEAIKNTEVKGEETMMNNELVNGGNVEMVNGVEANKGLLNNVEGVVEMNKVRLNGRLEA